MLILHITLQEIINIFYRAKNVNDYNYTDKYYRDVPGILEGMKHLNHQIPVLHPRHSNEKVAAVTLLSLKYVLGYGSGGDDYEKLTVRLKILLR